MRETGSLFGYLLLELLFSINEAAVSLYETRNGQRGNVSFEPARKKTLDVHTKLM